jgi:penicillin-binding protein 1A
VARAVRLVVAILLVAGFFVGGVGGGILVGYITTAKPVSLEAIYQSDEIRNTVIYDADGNVMIKLTGSDNIKRESFTYDDVKDTYIDDAFIAIEDERFEEHIGIDPKRIGSAILSGVAQQRLRIPRRLHDHPADRQDDHRGDETSAQRKIGEWAKAYRHGDPVHQQEIMQLYLNLVPMGERYTLESSPHPRRTSANPRPNSTSRSARSSPESQNPRPTSIR